MSSVSPKGQITVPAEVRQRMGLKPKDKVEFVIEGDDVKIVPAKSRVDLSFQVVPALKRPLTDRQMTDLAWDEHVRHLASRELT